MATVIAASVDNGRMQCTDEEMEESIGINEVEWLCHVGAFLAAVADRRGTS